MPATSPAAGILHCLDKEQELQELFMGSDTLPPLEPEQPATPDERSVDTGRIAVLESRPSDSMAEILMASRPAAQA